jgi:hypothetical protein
LSEALTPFRAVGTIYSATQASTGRQVAIKDMEVNSDQEQRQVCDKEEKGMGTKDRKGEI